TFAATDVERRLAGRRSRPCRARTLPELRSQRRRTRRLHGYQSVTHADPDVAAAARAQRGLLLQPRQYAVARQLYRRSGKDALQLRATQAGAAVAEHPRELHRDA